jgi:hypothetical protein
MLRPAAVGTHPPERAPALSKSVHEKQHGLSMHVLIPWTAVVYTTCNKYNSYLYFY